MTLFQASDFSYLSLSRGQILRRNARQAAQECESLHGTIKLTGVAIYAIENCGSCNCTLIIKKIEDGSFHEPYDESDLRPDDKQLTEKVCNHIYVPIHTSCQNIQLCEAEFIASMY